MAVDHRAAVLSVNPGLKGREVQKTDVANTGLLAYDNDAGSQLATNALYLRGYRDTPDALHKVARSERRPVSVLHDAIDEITDVGPLATKRPIPASRHAIPHRRP
jgi:hypothetical protein